uniref:Uncharacterized protein n=1 Tax=Strigamia maritima TaxID=126957 RepID=T1J8A6_STRMM
MQNRLILAAVWLLWISIEITDSCDIPKVIRGHWFSRENGVNTVTEFDSNSMTNRGTCLDISNTNNDNFTFVFQMNNCYSCVRILVRTINLVEKLETECVNLKFGVVPTLSEVCKSLDSTHNMITMFNENPTPLNCRSSLEGVWHFAYQRRDMFTGQCSNREANITSCQTPGTQFNIENQQFVINYKKCDGMDKTLDADVYYSCLGDWFVNKNHYFAAVNSKESRKEEKYRCFLKNRDDDLFLGISITPDCSVLKTPQESPERLQLTPVKAEVVIPGCNFPQNFTGSWINTANIDAEVIMNTTHIIETWHPDTYRYRRHIYVCQEQRGERYMLARLGVDGCQKDYICYEFLARHHNIIRFRKGNAMWINRFHTVCSWVSFPNKIDWTYNIMILKDPIPIRCPIAGKFKFDQKGDIPFTTRIRGGITQSPRPNVYCKENISDFSVCDNDQRQILIDSNYCLSVDYLGRPVDIYSDPDYIMSCVGFWKENLRSYLITTDEEDAFNRFRCWVYQRADLNSVMMSYGVGDYCNTNHRVDSFNFSEGASVAIYMTEYERERDDCPMFFDDGSNPWGVSSDNVKVFHYADYLNNNNRAGSMSIFYTSVLILSSLCVFVS